MRLMIFASLLTFSALSYSTPLYANHKAKMINESLNTSVNPCDDFYSYACGGWFNKHPIPDSKSSIGNFIILNDELQMTLNHILGNITLVQDKQNITQKVAAVYNACIEVPTKGDQLPVLRSLMNNSGYNDWPKMPGGNETDCNIANCTDFANISLFTLFTMPVGRDLTKLTSYVVQVDQLSFSTIGRNQLIRPNETGNVNITNAYRALVRTAIKLMKPNCSEEETSRIADELVDFEGQLANLTAPPEKRRNFLELYHRINITELEKNFSNVPLRRLLNKQFSYVNITLHENETIELFALNYYEKLNNFLERVNCDTLYNFAGLRVILGLAGRASEEFRNVSFDLSKASSGIVVDNPRWEKCLSTMKSIVPEVIGYLYVTEKFGKEAKKEVEDLARRIKREFNETLLNSTWMDNVTKAAAQEKLAKMISKIGYPSWILNTTYLEVLYKYVPNLNLSRSFLEMAQYIASNNWLQHLSHLRRDYDAESIWIVGPAVVNSFYSSSANEMVYRSGILQGVFYQYGLPRSINFGAIGMVVGHEMTHGFDDTGSQFDARGALKKWWSNTTRTEFTKKAQCFIHQYGNITDEEANKTAYERLLDEECDGEDTRLPGLEHLSGKQLFFIAEAMVWCSQVRKQRKQILIQYDTHSPDKYRVNIPMQNMPEFSSVFNCSSGSKMNATDRCQLW